MGHVGGGGEETALTHVRSEESSRNCATQEDTCVAVYRGKQS